MNTVHKFIKKIDDKELIVVFSTIFRLCKTAAGVRHLESETILSESTKVSDYHRDSLKIIQHRFQKKNACQIKLFTKR